MKKLFRVFCIFFLTIAVWACKEDDVAAPQPVSKTNDYGKAIIKVEQITTELESLVRGQWAYGNTFMDCATVTYKNLDDALETSISYSAGTPCSDGKVRSGKITMVKQNNSGLEAIVTFSNYYVDGQKLEGTFAFTQLTIDGKSFALNTVLNDGKILMPDGHFTNFSLNRKSYWKEGSGTPYNISDDVTEIIECHYGLTTKDKGIFLADITTPLLIKKSCTHNRFYAGAR